MNKRDRELLDKQLWGASPKPPRTDGILSVLVIVVFFAGLASGDILFAQPKDPMPAVSNEALALLPTQLRATDR